VTGAGPVGILSALIAKRFGSLEVSISDVSTDRLRIAEHLGLETKVPENSEVDVLIECSGAQEALDHGYELIDRGGRIVFVGIPSSRNVTIPLSELFEKE